MRSTFVIFAIALTVALLWYSNFAVELGLRHPGDGVSGAVVIAIVVAIALFGRRRPTTKSVSH